MKREKVLLEEIQTRRFSYYNTRFKTGDGLFPQYTNRESVFPNGKWFTNKTMAKGLRAEGEKEKSIEAVKLCLECSPLQLGVFEWKYVVGGYMHSARNATETVYVLPHEKFVVYDLRFEFEFDKRKKDQIKRRVLREAKKVLKNPIKTYEDLRKVEDSIGEHTSGIDNLLSIDGIIYRHYDFILCQEHQAQRQKTVERITKCFFGGKRTLAQIASRWGYTPNQRDSLLKEINLDDFLRDNFTSKEIRPTIVDAIDIENLRKKRGWDFGFRGWKRRGRMIS